MRDIAHDKSADPVPTRYFEDFTVGEMWQSPPVTVTADDIMAFGRNYDPQPMHTDPEAAAQGPFGGLIASGFLIAALSVRVFVESGGYGKTPAMGLGIDELRWQHAVKAGDTLVFTREVIELRRSASNPGFGIMKVRVTVRNQVGTTVMTMLTAGRLPARPTVAPAPPAPATPAADESGFVPFHELIAANAARHPEAAAFREGGRTLDWRTFDTRMGQVARALMAVGIAPRDNVAVLGYPSLPYAECLFGIVAARACVVPLVVSASVDAVKTMLHDSAARLLFLDPDAGPAMAEMAARFSAETGAPVVRFGAGGEDGAEYPAWRDTHAAMAAVRPLPVAEPDDPFNIIYSSGTTGMPKGIVHLHGMRQRQARRNGFGFTPQSRTLLSTPMYSNTTITPMIGTVANGGACTLMRKFDAGRYLALAAQQRATHTMLVPVQYKRILAHADFPASDLSAFELSQCTGAPLEASVKREIIGRWPGRFMEVYGMTEGGVSFFLDARLHPDKLHTVGRPGHGTEVFLIDESGKRLPPGPTGITTGEVVGRSPFMMAGYHNRPDATAAIRWYDGEGRMHHRTGDIGRFDAEGFLTLLDRSKDVIISGGHNIYPADLEAVISTHADVLECAVIGVPSAQWGETPLALVAARPGARIDAQALREWVNAQVGRMQRLAAVELRDELPRSHLGKLSKKDLRAPYWSKLRTGEEQS